MSQWKVHYGHVLLCLFILGSIFRTEGQARVEYAYTRLEDKREAKVIDLTGEITSACDQSLTKRIDNTTLEVRYPAKYLHEAKIVSDNLTSAIIKTQRILSPLPVENVRFYLYQRDFIPAGYKISDKIENEAFYLHLWIFKDRNEVSFDCYGNNSLCENIFSTLPHELAHSALNGLLETENNRWFQEGLANYVGGHTIAEFSTNSDVLPSDAIPEVSLHRKEIRESILKWGYSHQNDAQNEYFRYQAALRLIELLVRESANNKVELPLRTLLTELKKCRDVKKSPAKASDLLAIIREQLKVDIQSLGMLTGARKSELIGKAISVFEYENASESDKYKALYITAGIDDLFLGEKTLTSLLKIAYADNVPELWRRLAASALIGRARHPDFDAAVNLFMKENPHLKIGSIKKATRFLKKLSLRPALPAP